MKLINKTKTTLIFNDINLVLMYDKDGKGLDVDDCDIKNSPTLKHYIEKGLVDVINPSEENVVYRSIKNRQEVVEKQSKINSPNKINKVGSERNGRTDSDIVLGGQSKVKDSRVYNVPQTSSITKFRETGIMDIAYCGPCFSEDTIIITSDGVKFINDVTNNDSVLTHMGRWRKVKSVHKSLYNDFALSIKPNLSRGISINCTPDHNFYVKENEDYKWKNASDIDVENLFVMPRVKFEKGKEFILLSDYVHVDFDEQQNGFCSAIKLTERFMEIIWAYISSGYIKKNSEVCFKISKNSLSEFINIMEENFGVKEIQCKEKETHSLYSCKSVSLANFFRTMCGNENKKIPSFLFKKDFSSRFLKIVLNKKEVNKNGSIIIYTKHPLIAWGIRLLLFESSVISSIQHVHLRKNYCVSFCFKQYENILREKNVISNSFKYNNLMTKNKPFSYTFCEDAILVPLSSKENGEYFEHVYNLEVEEDESYTADFFAVHNCYDAGGYAKMNRNFMFGLDEKDDVNLKLDLSKDATIRKQVEDELSSKLDILRKKSVGDDCVKIYGSTATTVLWGGYKVLFTMMETEKVHPQYIEKCDMVNEVWLPTDWCIEKFRESGLRNKIYKMPIGVDIDNYYEGMNPMTFGGKEKGFIFLSVFGWSLRKGYDILLKAYYEEFSSNDDVTLVICSRYAGKTDKTSKDVIKNDIRNIERSINKKNKPRPPLLIADVVPEKMMGNLYNSAHAYVCISRGEGFGLPYCEASMCGLPIISSNYSGQKDFLNYDNSFLVEPEGFAVNTGAEWVSYYYTDMPMANFGEKSIEQTKSHMRYVYENYAIAKEKNRKLQNLIKENYNWEKCIDRMHERLKVIYSEVKHRGEK